MTYQELLEEFDRRRAFPRTIETGMPGVVQTDIMSVISDTQWAIQSILEKLRDGDKQ